jgi:hypothetical protein
MHVMLGNMPDYQLSSDVLERQFGTVYADIIEQTVAQRVVCTRRSDTDQALEFAIVTFRPEIVEKFLAIHQEIVAGGMMGKTFRKHGAAFKRNTLTEFTYPLPARLAGLFGIEGLAMVVVVAILVGDHGDEYSQNIEVYSPVVHWPSPTILDVPLSRMTTQTLDDFFKDFLFGE